MVTAVASLRTTCSLVRKRPDGCTQKAEPWARYDTATRTTRRFGSDTPGLLEDPAGDERALWDGIR